jgi:Tn3 transposase DDE domain
VYAGVIGIGCTIGIRKMARISHPLSESELENAVNWFFSVDNVNAASDRVLQLTDRLELPKLLRRTRDRHRSSNRQCLLSFRGKISRPHAAGMPSCMACLLR